MGTDNFYTVKTSRGTLFYEAPTVLDVWRMLMEDGYGPGEVIAVDTDLDNVLSFVVYGHKGE